MNARGTSCQPRTGLAGRKRRCSFRRPPNSNRFTRVLQEKSLDNLPGDAHSLTEGLANRSWECSVSPIHGWNHFLG